LESSREIEEKWENHRHFQDKVEHLKTNIDRLNAKPKDRKLRDSVAMNLEEIKRLDQPVHASQSDILAVGMAAAIVGESEAAEQVADDVLRVAPNQEAAKQLKEDVRDGKIERRYQQKEKDKPKPQNPTKQLPNGRAKPENGQLKPPVVESPAMIKLDTTWQSKLIPKAAISDFVKWDKEQ
jgi:hypothetical protein